MTRDGRWATVGVKLRAEGSGEMEGAYEGSDLGLTVKGEREALSQNRTQEDPSSA